MTDVDVALAAYEQRGREGETAGVFRERGETVHLVFFPFFAEEDAVEDALHRPAAERRTEVFVQHDGVHLAHRMAHDKALHREGGHPDAVRRRKFGRRHYARREGREVSARAVAGEHDILRVRAQPLRVVREEAHGRKHVLHLLFQSDGGHQAIAHAHHEEALGGEIHAVIFVQILVAVHPGAAVDVDDDGEHARGLLGAIDVEFVHRVAVREIVEHLDGNARGRGLLRDPQVIVLFRVAADDLRGQPGQKHIFTSPATGTPTHVSCRISRSRTHK